MTRVKKQIITSVSPEEANTAMTAFATASAKLKQIEGKIEAEVAKIRDKFAEQIEGHQATIKQSFEVLNAYADLNEKLFADKRTVELANGTIGYRLGTPKVECAAKKWEDALVLMKQHMPEFVRTKSEPDKEKLIAHRADEQVQQLMKQCMVKVVQIDTFFAEPKQELINTVV